MSLYVKYITHISVATHRASADSNAQVVVLDHFPHHVGHKVDVTLDSACRACQQISRRKVVGEPIELLDGWPVRITIHLHNYTKESRFNITIDPSQQ